MGRRRPYLVERMQGFGTTIFAEMSALAVATGSINLGQGFPDTDGPPEVLDAAVAAIRAGRQPVPARHRHPRAARTRSPSTSERFYGLDVRPRHRGARHRRRHRGDRGGAARAVRAGRRGRHVRAVLRLVRRVHRDGRCAATRRARCAPPDYAFDARRARAPRSRPGRGCCCSTRRTTRPARCSPRASSS